MLCPALCVAEGGGASVVAESGAGHGWSVNYPKQRKLFAMAGRLWLFYSDGSDGVYRTSADGTAWSAPTVFGPGGHFGHRFGGWFDGTHFHYALCTASLGGEVWYQRGRPGADGSMAWCAAAQVAHATPPDKNVMYPKITVDSTGAPWVSFMELVYQEPNTPPYDAVVLRSSGRDGAWATAPGFPFRLVAAKGTEGYPDPVGVPLSGGRTFWFYNTSLDGGDVFASRLWNGAAWEAETVVLRSASPYSLFNAVADGDAVHVVYADQGLAHRRWTADGGWSAPCEIAAAGSGHCSITRTGPGRVIVTWLDPAEHRVWYRELSEAGWLPAVLWSDESAAGLAGAGINLNTLVESGAGFRHAAVWSTGGAAPFGVRAVVLKAVP